MMVMQLILLQLILLSFQVSDIISYKYYMLQTCWV